ncbi:MAG: SprB repeat-containing protein, partial [Bacteroidetes bacterium]|nr:SprB repeat-containing protein [Bacteroidota bacterium]
MKKLIFLLALTVIISPTFSQVTATIDSIYNATCFGSWDGFANATGGGGVPGYTYLWSDPGSQTSATASGLGAGTYTVTITDAIAAFATASVVISEPAPLMVTIDSITNINCAGGWGNIWITGSGGVGGYWYLWSIGSTTQDLSGLAAGIYTVTVVDANGCSATGDTTLTEPSPITSVITNFTNPSTCGATDGSIEITVAGGTSNYNIDWSNGVSLMNVAAGAYTETNLAGGSYWVTVTDANGCTTSSSQTLTDPSTTVVSVDAITNLLCAWDATGTISITASAGSPPYTDIWSDGSITQNPSNLSAGTYSVTVTDASGCYSSADTTIISPSPVQITMSPVSPGCNGSTDGSISVNATGGTGGFSYIWSTLQTDQNLTSLSGGVYIVTATDANGCTSYSDTVLLEPPAITISMVTSDPSCNACSDGWATATASGGTPFYTYLWDAPAGASTTQTAFGLTTGAYSVTVTDVIACTATEIVTLVDTVCGTCGQIKGLVFDDLNNDGVQNGGEKGLAGV